MEEFEPIRAELAHSLDALAGQALTTTPLSPIEVVARSIDIQSRAADLVAAAVERARRSGCTWQDIGDVVGISRQGAFQRFGRPVDPRTGALIDTTPLAGAEPRALALFALIAARQWDAARADFDTTMSTKLSAQHLADTWAQIVSMVGAYEHAGAPTARRLGDYTVVDVPLAFEAGDKTGRISFNPDGTVSGLFILNPEFAQQN